MLRIFSKIRQTLLEQSALRKYLIYAIGEIALVVIGILIALQIDNWNENQYKLQRERDYLLALNGDFRQTQTEFETNKWEHQLVKLSMEQLLDWIEDKTVPSDKQYKFDSLLATVFYRSSFDPPLGTIETILGSGNVDLIRNKNLVALLTQWTAIVKNYQNEEFRAVDHFYESIYPYLSSKLNIQDMDKSIPAKVRWPHGPTTAYKLISDLKFINLIYVHWVIQWNILDSYALNIDQSLKEILELVRKDLDTQ